MVVVLFELLPHQPHLKKRILAVEVEVAALGAAEVALAFPCRGSNNHAEQ